MEKARRSTRRAFSRAVPELSEDLAELLQKIEAEKSPDRLVRLAEDLQRALRQRRQGAAG